MNFALFIGCVLCVWALLNILSGERNRRFAELSRTVRRELANAPHEVETVAPAPAPASAVKPVATKP